MNETVKTPKRRAGRATTGRRIRTRLALPLTVAVLLAACGSPDAERALQASAARAGTTITEPPELDDGNGVQTPATAVHGDDSDVPASVPPATSPSAPAPVGSPAQIAEGLVWTAVAIEWDDTLNVRSGPGPGESVMATLDPWASPLPVAGDAEGPESLNEGQGTWVRLSDDGSDEGWVNRRFLVAQPDQLTDADRRAMTEASSRLLSVLTGAGDAPTDLRPVLGNQGVWIGGTGVFADLPHPWNWYAIDEVGAADDWRAERDFELQPEIDFRCPECSRTLTEFVGLDLQDSPVEILIDDLPDEGASGFVDGALWQAPRTLHRVVLYQPSSEFVDEDGVTGPNLDWRRIHLVFDWSGGEPRIAMVNVHGWTP